MSGDEGGSFLTIVFDALLPRPLQYIKQLNVSRYLCDIQAIDAAFKNITAQADREVLTKVETVSSLVGPTFERSRHLLGFCWTSYSIFQPA